MVVSLDCTSEYLLEKKNWNLMLAIVNIYGTIILKPKKQEDQLESVLLRNSSFSWTSDNNFNMKVNNVNKDSEGNK